MDERASPVPDSLESRSSSFLSLRRLLLIGIFTRLFVDTGIQIFAPFLSIVAAGLGISIITLGALISLRSLMGLAGPGFGSLTNSFGYRNVLRLLLLLGSAGMFIFSFSQNMLMLVAATILMGLGLFSFASILQAYMSAFIPYRNRARGLGTVEVSWALAGIIGLFVSGLLIQRFDWRVPFWLLGAGLLISFLIVGSLPGTDRTAKGLKPAVTVPNLRQLVQKLQDMVKIEENVRSAWGAILVAGLVVFAMVNLGMIYGTWLGSEYGLNAAQLGLVALTLGLADLTAIAFVSISGDRIGKHRLTLASTICSIAAYLLVPILNINLFAAIGGLLFARLTFEASMVSNILLLSEQVPTHRVKVLTLSSACVTIGVALGSIVGPIFYTTWGVIAIGLISAVAAFLASVILYRWVTEG